VSGPIAAGRKPLRRPWEKRFVMVPWLWVDVLKKAKSAATYHLAMHLLYENFRTGGDPIAVSNVSVRGLGMTKYQKSRALQELARLGLIELKIEGQRAPVATVLFAKM
jgi:hypothetical protein